MPLGSVIFSYGFGTPSSGSVLPLGMIDTSAFAIGSPLYNTWNVTVSPTAR